MTHAKSALSNSANRNPIASHFHLAPTFRSMLIASVSLVGLSSLVSAQAGHLDPNFGARGIFSLSQTTAGGGNNLANAVLLQGDGKVVVAGQIGSRSGLLRLNANGTLDSSFGSGGTVVTSIGGDIEQVFVGLGIQPDGKIVVVGTGCPPRADVARFNPNGSLDTTFGNGGIAAMPMTAHGLAVQSDGKIIVTGANLGTAVMGRLLSNGLTDTAFGTNGIAPLAAGPSAIALQADGKILIGAGGLGASPFLNPLPGAGGVARYNTNGSLDRTFGVLGQAASIVAPSALAVQTDGKILAAGAITTQLAMAGNATGFGIVRLNANGSLDSTFGARGGLGTAFPNANVTSASAIAFQANGDIVAAGEAGSLSTSTGLLIESFAVTRHLPTGKLDPTFGKGGLVTTSFGTTAAFISSVALQANGDIVVAGSNGVGVIEVARYLGQ